MAVSSTSTNSANLHVYYTKRWLSTLQPRLVLYPLGIKARIPKGGGKQIKWLIYTKVSSSSTPLTEGTNPSEIAFTTANVTATALQYGQFVKVSDLLDFTAIDPVKDNLSELLSKAGSETIEDLIVAELDSALTVQRVNARSTNDLIVASDLVNMREFVKAMITLKVAFVGQHEQGSYMSVLHPSCEYDMLSESNLGSWLDIQSYPSADRSKIMNAELGRAYGMRFLVSDKMAATANAGSISVKQNYVIGEECFGCVELNPDSVELIMKNPGESDTSNALNMFSTVGYKIKGFVAKNFAAARGIQLRGAATI